MGYNALLEINIALAGFRKDSTQPTFNKTFFNPRSSGENHMSSNVLSRRQLIQNAAALGLVGIGSNFAIAEDAVSSSSLDPGKDYRIKNHKLRQSVMAWCFKPMQMEKLIAGCAAMGLDAMEGIDPKYYPLMKKQGLKVSLCGSHSFKAGPVNPANHASCIKELKEAIDRAVEWNCANVITFTGMREKGISDQQSSKNCVDCWKQVIDYAEKKKINLTLEHLNTRDNTHPMKGHPGYYGDDLELCIDLIKKVDSPCMKLLFDIYHVQVMHGDVIRRFRQYKDFISHVHTAGVPGRGELDADQELNYHGIIKAIHATGYKGYITQEFIPNWKDKLAALRHGVATCDF